MVDTTTAGPAAAAAIAPTAALPRVQDLLPLKKYTLFLIGAWEERCIFYNSIIVFSPKL